MTTFNPDTFEQQTYEEAMPTRYIPVPEAEYTAFIDDYVWREVNDSPVLDVVFAIADEDLKTKLDMEKPTVKQSIFIDVDDQGRIQFSAQKNVKLGRLREAVRQNETGKPWSFSMLKGQGPVKIKVTQQADKDDPETIYNRVVRVTAI